jgi:hypothetical protein
MALLVQGSRPTHALAVTLVSWDPGSGPLATRLESTAVNNLCCGGFVERFDPTSVPFTDSHRAESGGVISETAYALSPTGFSITFVEHFRLERSGAESSGAIYFTLDEDTAYELAGDYSMIGWREVLLESTLWDLTAGVLMFDNRQDSSHTQDEVFQLGSQGGDMLNRLSGSRTGVLLAGNYYRLTYRAGIGSTEPGDAIASATGSVQLTFVPELSTGLLVMSGLLGLAYRQSRHGCAWRIEALRKGH